MGRAKVILKIWITRTEPGATALAAALTGAGHEVIKAPVLAVGPLPFNPPTGPFDIGVFLSVHAVRIAAVDLARMADTLIAVGHRTRAALGELGFDATAPSLETSEGLLQAMPDPAGRRVVVIAGSGGRDWLRTALTNRGARVTRIDVYVRYPLTPAIDTGDVDAIVASSGTGFAQLARVWHGNDGNPDIPVLVPSARVAALGPSLGMAAVLDCGGAHAQAVERALERLRIDVSTT